MIVVIRPDLSLRLEAAGPVVSMPARGHLDCSLETVARLFGLRIAGWGCVVAGVWTPAGPVRLHLVDVGVVPGKLRWRVEADGYAPVFWLCARLLGSPAAAVATALDGGTDVWLDTLLAGFSEYLAGRAAFIPGEDIGAWVRRSAEHTPMYLEVGSLAFAAWSEGPTHVERPFASGRWAKRPHGGLRPRVLGALRGRVRREPRWEPALRRDRGSLHEALLQLARVRQTHFDWFAFRHPGAPLEDYRGYLDTLWAVLAARSALATRLVRVVVVGSVALVTGRGMGLAVVSEEVVHVETRRE